MSPKTFFVTLLQLGLAGSVLLLSHYQYAWVAAILVLMPTAITWYQGGRTRKALLLGSPSAVIGLSVVILVALSREPLSQSVFPVTTQVGLSVFYAAWLMWLRQLRLRGRSTLAVVGVQQFVGVSAIFLATAFWHWPEIVTVALTWAVVMVTTYWYLQVTEERASTILSAAWALVAAEIAWILSSWQVNYILFDGGLIIPQAALVITGVGYCFANIYHTHTQKRLSRRRLLEYVVIAGLVLAVVIAGTHWNGTS